MFQAINTPCKCFSQNLLLIFLLALSTRTPYFHAGSVVIPRAFFATVGTTHSFFQLVEHFESHLKSLHTCDRKKEENRVKRTMGQREVGKKKTSIQKIRNKVKRIEERGDKNRRTRRCCRREPSHPRGECDAVATHRGRSSANAAGKRRRKPKLVFFQGARSL